MPWDYFSARWISAVLVAGKRGLRVFPDMIKELPRGWLTSRSKENQAQLAPKKIFKRYSKASSAHREFCLLHHYPDSWYLWSWALPDPMGKNLRICKIYLWSNENILCFSHTSWCSGKYGPAPSGLLSAFGFVIQGGKCPKKPPRLAKCCCLLVNICDLIWPRAVSSSGINEGTAVWDMNQK